MLTFMDDVVAVYAPGGELDRMAAEANRLEWERTCELLLRWLPPAPARVLDLGGGPGRQAAWIQQQGYPVKLIDLVPLHVQAAQARGVEAQVGDARHVPECDESVDAVVLLGPLYHLPVAADRAQVLREVWRVLVQGGVVVAAAMSRWARVLVKAAEGQLDDPGWHQHTLAMMRHGRAAQGDDRWDLCTYRHDPEEFTAELEAGGFRGVQVVGVQGPIGAWARRDPALHDHAMELARAAESAMAGCSIHMLGYGVKR